MLGCPSHLGLLRPNIALMEFRALFVFFLFLISLTLVFFFLHLSIIVVESLETLNSKLFYLLLVLAFWLSVYTIIYGILGYHWNEQVKLLRLWFYMLCSWDESLYVILLFN